MARLATNSFSNVNTVVEVNKVWQIMDSGPFQRFPGAKAFPNGFEHGAIAPDLGMTPHAGFASRHSCKGRLFHAGVAVAAIQPQFPNMMLMAEWHWLLASCFSS